MTFDEIQLFESNKPLKEPYQNTIILWRRVCRSRSNSIHRFFTCLSTCLPTRSVKSLV